MRKENKKIKFLRFMKAYNKKETSVLLWHPIGILMFLVWLLMLLTIPILAALDNIPHFARWVIDDIKDDYKVIVPMKRLFTFKYKGGSDVHS